MFVRISGYGQTGPRATDAGYASVCEAVGGMRAVNGYADRPPVRPNLSLGDTLAGLHGAFGAVMALLHRTRVAAGGSGHAAAVGQVVDASISESVFNMLEACVTEAAEAGVERECSGSTISGVCIVVCSLLCAALMRLFCIQESTEHLETPPISIHTKHKTKKASCRRARGAAPTAAMW